MSCWSNIEGTWSYKDLIGSKFKIKSVRLSHFGELNKSGAFKYSGEVLTLKAIYFRVSTDGKTLTLFRMEEVCGKLFLPKDLELVEISPISHESTICGKFSPGKKNLIGIEESELVKDNLESNPKSKETNFPNVPAQTNHSLIEKEAVKELWEDPFLQNINSWEIINL